MTGREKFDKNKNKINFLFRIVDRFPKKMKKYFWKTFQNSNRNYATLMRYVLLKSLCKTVGENVLIGPNVDIIDFDKLVIGKNVSIHKNCYIDATGGIQIGNDVSIAHGTSIISVNHTWEDVQNPIKYNPIVLRKITISNDVWIGAGCRILAGVKIETRTVIAAGAVVTKDVRTHTLVAGIPAKIIKQI